MHQTANLDQSLQMIPAHKKEANGNGRSTTNAATDHTSWADLLADYDFPRPKQGEILQGQIIRIQDDAMFVDVGSKRDAIIPHDEIADMSDHYLNTLSRGDMVPVYVTRTPVGDQELIVSLEKGLQQLDWDRAEELLAADETVEGEVVGHNKGGLLVEFGRITGFVPNSHDPDLRRIHDPQQRMSLRQKKIGTTLSMKVVEIDRSRQRLIMSATAAETELRRRQLESLEVGQIITGEVVNLAHYGAFVDIGSMSGLLHISKISWGKIEHPSDVLQVGDEVEVRIDKIDVERERLSLNRKALQPGPWELFARDHDIGDLMDGVVTAVTGFGAFVLVAENIEGLVHISEIDNQYLERPDSVVQTGDTVLVRILSLDIDRQRLGLSMRRVSDQEEVNWMLDQQQQNMPPAQSADSLSSESESDLEMATDTDINAEETAVAIEDSEPAN